MTRGTSDWKFLLLTAGVVALLGFQAVRDIAHDDAPLAVTASESPVERAPASIDAKKLAPKPAAPKVDSLVEWNWSCRKKAPETLNVSGEYFRLRGKGCAADFQPDRLTITNETNGFTASVIDMGHRLYSTDFIRLHAGPNRIRVRYLDETGQAHESVHVVNASL